jgi:ubiquinone/menaquinone biosynthesis C-methylase UbiE
MSLTHFFPLANDCFRKKRREFSHKFHLTRPIEFSILLDFLNLDPLDKICDLGCGDGYWTSRFGEILRSKVVGLDPEWSSVKRASKFYEKKSHFVRGCAESLPFATKSFDKVVGICAMEHFVDDELSLSEVYRVLNDNGIIALSLDSLSLPGIPDQYKAKHSLKYHVNHLYTHLTIKLKLSRARFEFLKYQYVGTSKIFDFIQRAQFNISGRINLLGFLLFPLIAIIERISNNNNAGHILVIQAQKILKESESV